MKNLPIFGALVAAFVFASSSATLADARASCRGAGNGVKCQAAKTPKKLAKTTINTRRATRTRTRLAAAQSRRITRRESDEFPWHGWAGSFHLDGARYPGGNPAGPAAYYNNYEGGFHNVAFWMLQDRGRF